MELTVTRSYVKDEGSWLHPPAQSFVLTSNVTFSSEERWIIDTHNLYHHRILDRTPPWYFSALKDAQRSKARAEREGEEFEWPWYVPPTLPEEWWLTVERLLCDPIYIVTFETALELNNFEPRMMAAFAQFGQFLRQYGSRPRTIVRRF